MSIIPPLDERLAPRRTIFVSGVCRARLVKLEGALVNISREGCCVEINIPGLAVGSQLTISPAGIESLSGTVRWIESGMIGIRFDKLLYGPVLDHLAARHAAVEPWQSRRDGQDGRLSRAKKARGS